MNSRDYKDQTFSVFAEIANSFASPKRLEIIDLLSQGEKDVETLAKQTNMNFANTSRHIQILKHAGIIKGKRNGVHIFYSVASPEVISFWKSLQALSEKTTSEIRELSKLFLEERDVFEPVSITELRKKIAADEAILIDVRPADEYNQGHLPKALSYPVKELADKLEKLSSKKEIIAYCRGAYCVLAADAVKLLKSKGYNASLFKQDINDWAAEGYPVEKDKT